MLFLKKKEDGNFVIDAAQARAIAKELNYLAEESEDHGFMAQNFSVEDHKSKTKIVQLFVRKEKVEMKELP